MSSGLRQYNPKKNQKGVSKGESGCMHDFFFYAGAKSTGTTTCGAANVVKKLCETMPSKLNHKLFFDNWFCTFQLCLDLKADGILTAATLCKDRLAGCKLLSDTELKQKGRGSFCFQTDQNTGLSIVKWYANKPVHLVSTYIGVQADGTVKRLIIKEKCMSKWNVLMSSRDTISQWEALCLLGLADMLIALYRTRIKTKRWYLSLIFQAVDIANAWLLYRRYANQLKILAIVTARFY
eukprot:gene1358-1499_t